MPEVRITEEMPSQSSDQSASGFLTQGSDNLAEVHAQLRKDLEEAAEIRSHRNIEEAAKW